MFLKKFEKRIDYLFEKAQRESSVDVQHVISDAAKTGALGNSRLGLEITKVIAAKAELALEEALKSYDRIAVPFGKKSLLAALRSRIKQHFQNDVRDIGRASLAFQNGRDQVMDAAIYQAQEDLLEQIKQFELKLTNYRPAAFIERHKTIVQLVSFAFGVVALLVAVASYFKK